MPVLGEPRPMQHVASRRSLSAAARNSGGPHAKLPRGVWIAHGTAKARMGAADPGSRVPAEGGLHRVHGLSLGAGCDTKSDTSMHLAVSHGVG